MADEDRDDHDYTIADVPDNDEYRISVRTWFGLWRAVVTGTTRWDFPGGRHASWAFSREAAVWRAVDKADRKAFSRTEEVRVKRG